MSDERIPATKKALNEALKLSEEIIKNIELSEIPLSNIALKTARLSRLINDFEMTEIIKYEISGYPTTTSGFIPKDKWKLGIKANRLKTEDTTQYIYHESIEQLENELDFNKIAIEVARDADISSSPSNPQHRPYTGNWKERTDIRERNVIVSQRLASRRSFIYQYVLQKYLELNYSNIADDIFANIREKVDKKIGKLVPEAVKRFNAVYDNLKSENTEDWSNAVHSCRRIIEDLANAVYPPTEDKKIEIEGKEKIIKLDNTHYRNRIMEFIIGTSKSKSFTSIVGSQLKFIEDRLKSTDKASSKGTHTIIISKDEANRTVLYTYLLIGDILSLKA